MKKIYLLKVGHGTSGYILSAVNTNEKGMPTHGGRRPPESICTIEKIYPLVLFPSLRGYIFSIDICDRKIYPLRGFKINEFPTHRHA